MKSIDQSDLEELLLVGEDMAAELREQAEERDAADPAGDSALAVLWRDYADRFDAVRRRIEGLDEEM